jgi:hypothetical protein
MDYELLSKWTSGEKELTVSNITQLVVEIIKITDVLNVPGNEKKKIAIDTINDIITHSDCSNKEDLLFVVNSVVPQMIDCMISIDRREIIIKKAKKYFSCFINA